MAWFRRRTPELVDGSELAATGKVVAVGELHTAPLTGKPCVHWHLTIAVPEPVDASKPSLAPMAGLRNSPLSGSGGAVFGGRLVGGNKGPMTAHRKHAGSVFALDIDGKRVTVDSAMADVDGPPEVVIPRDVLRERKLLEAWGLAATYRSEPEFSELVLAVGDRVAVTGTLLVAADVVRVTGTVTLRKKR